MAKTKRKYFDKPIKVEENLWQLAPDYYRILITKGSGKNKNTFSEYVDGTISTARKRKKIFVAEIEKKDLSKIDKGDITFHDFCKDIFLPFCRDEGLSPSTITGYKDKLNAVMSDLGGLKLREINTEILQRTFTKLKNKNKVKPNDKGEFEKISTTTANGIYRMVRNVLNRAVDWDYMEYNPLRKVKCPPTAKVEKESYNKGQLFEILRLLYQYNKKYGTMYILEICTGVRRSELCGVHIPEDFDFEYESINQDGETEIIGKMETNRSAVFDKEKKKMVEVKTKTPKSQRTNFLPDFCVAVIKDFIATYRTNEITGLKEKYGQDIEIADNLFLGKWGGIMHPDTASHNWLKFTRRYGLNENVTLHGLRHSYCTMQRKNKLLDEFEVQILLGHTNQEMTDHYSHINREIGNNVVSVFNDFNFEEDTGMSL